ncbi:hypothetical protein RHS04_03107 [Rhizoctonia solani]|uniref:Uncharacterized protein n=1 Tax=Rhizoctonia solani TaxID=456999 RepID=A0A8H7LKQ1_9AGAM|nr:hypothetical protein RHS04_03107 [Rhizoctonia solani]KAF8759554.1 hypothetical protein RHS01_01591 [Rhizoctonia solani]
MEGGAGWTVSTRAGTTRIYNRTLPRQPCYSAVDSTEDLVCERATNIHTDDADDRSEISSHPCETWLKACAAIEGGYSEGPYAALTLNIPAPAHEAK